MFTVHVCADLAHSSNKQVMDHTTLSSAILEQSFSCYCANSKTLVHHYIDSFPRPFGSRGAGGCLLLITIDNSLVRHHFCVPYQQKGQKAVARDS